MSNIIPIGAGALSSTSGSGPEDPMLEERVKSLEARSQRIEESLQRVEVAIVRTEATLAQMPRMSDIAALRSDTSEIKGKISQLPTTWTLFAFAISLFLASLGLAFSFARLFKL